MCNCVNKQNLIFDHRAPPKNSLLLLLHFCQTLDACQEMQRTNLTVFCLSMYNSQKYFVKPLCDWAEINRKGIYFFHFTLNHKAT